MPQAKESAIPDFYIERAVGKATMPHMHDHNAFELYWLCRGEREYFIGDQFYKIGEGDLVLIPPNVLHRTAGKGATRFLLYFSEDFLRRYFTEEMLSALSLDRTLIFRPSESLCAEIESELAVMLSEYADGEMPFLASRLCHLLFRKCEHTVVQAIVGLICFGGGIVQGEVVLVLLEQLIEGKK